CARSASPSRTLRSRRVALLHSFEVERQIGRKGDVSKSKRQQFLAGEAEDVAQGAGSRTASVHLDRRGRRPPARARTWRGSVPRTRAAPRFPSPRGGRGSSWSRLDRQAPMRARAKLPEKMARTHSWVRADGRCEERFLTVILADLSLCW